MSTASGEDQGELLILHESHRQQLFIQFGNHLLIMDQNFGMDFHSFDYVGAVTHGTGVVCCQHKSHEFEEHNILPSPTDSFTTAQGCDLWGSTSISSPQSHSSDLDLLFGFDQSFDSSILELGNDVFNTSLAEAARRNHSSLISPSINLYHEPMHSCHSSLGYWVNPGALSSDVYRPICSTFSPPPTFQQPHLECGCNHQKSEVQVNEDLADIILENLVVLPTPEQTPPPPSTKEASPDPLPAPPRSERDQSARAKKTRIKSVTSVNGKIRKWKVSLEPSLKSRGNDAPPLKGRHKHNQIEKKYRSKLNGAFDILLAALPHDLIAEFKDAQKSTKQPEKAISKSEVLALANGYIEDLEDGMEELECEKASLVSEVARLRKELE